MTAAVQPRVGKKVWVPALGISLIFGSAALHGHLELWESGKARVLTVYADQLANGIPTVCNGLTRHVTAKPIIVGQVWTNDECQAEEDSALERVQSKLVVCFKKGPPQSVFDMATSHAWNLGVGNTCGSQAMQMWNRGEWRIGCARMSVSAAGKLVWVYANGKFVRGLANRRSDETQKCLKDIP